MNKIGLINWRREIIKRIGSLESRTRVIELAISVIFVLMFLFLILFLGVIKKISHN